MNRDFTWDWETSGLLDNSSIDYTASPYKLKDSYVGHCIVVEMHGTGKLYAFYDGPTYELDGRAFEEESQLFEDTVYILPEGYTPIEYVHRPLKDFKLFVEKCRPTRVVAHNQINFDLMVSKLLLDMDFDIGGFSDQWCGQDVWFEDTLVTSKTLNPDRLGGHSLDNLGKKVGLNKIEFRKNLPSHERFKEFGADMLYYCIRDVQVNTKVDQYLQEEKRNWDWDDAILLEKQVAHIITQQEHRGFGFDKELAEKNIEELDGFMRDREARVNPVLPRKPATKKFEKEHTPPKIQFKKNGDPSSHLEKFAEKHGGTLTIKGPAEGTLEVFGEVFELPTPANEDGTRLPLLTEEVAEITDTAHIKSWLMAEFGWEPSEWKQRDITRNSKKERYSDEDFEKAVDRYVEQTIKMGWEKARCLKLKTTIENLKSKLLQLFKERDSIKVYTSPSFTVGQEKEICPRLEKLSEKFPYAKDIVEYLTYRHRRNSILGGDLDWEDGEEASKGYIAYIRDDGRIGTPADTCGCNTARMKHKQVANIPRITSLYGENMRGLFGVEDGFYQMGYDFDSLEARMESHYCYPFEKSRKKEYCKSLLLEKPNDVHSTMSRKISEIIGENFDRQPAKSVKYACLPTDNTEVLTKEGWKPYGELKIGEEILSLERLSQQYVWDKISEIHFYEDADVSLLSNNWISLESTDDHRWYGTKRFMVGSGDDSQRFYKDGFYTTDEINSETNIKHCSTYLNLQPSVTKEEASLVAWLLSDGYYSWSELSETASSSYGKRKGIVGSISQDQNKYVDELEKVLNDCGAEYTKRTEGTFNTYLLKSKWLREFLDRVVGSREQKHDVNWVKWLLNLDLEGLNAFLFNFFLADGHKGNSNSFNITQNKGNIADAIMLAGNLTNHRVQWCYKDNNEKCLSIKFSKIDHTTGQKLVKTHSRKTDVFCLSLSNESFVIRQGKTITLTGNCTYGAQANKVAETIGKPLGVGNLVYDAFWSAAQPLKDLKIWLEGYWEGVADKQFILGLDGRKVPTRTKHSILNTLFQSAGVICAKRAMVIHYYKLKDAGLTVDFFRDDWKNKNFSQQLIAYHDEAQSEVSKDLVRLVAVKTKEEAEALAEKAKSSGKVPSDIGELKDGRFYIAYTRSGHLAVEAVEEAGQYYKLNVDLTAGYMVGKTWRDCH